MTCEGGWWERLEAGDLALARRTRPVDLGPLEPLIRDGVDPQRLGTRDNERVSDRIVTLVTTATPLRAWACRVDRRIQYDAADLTLDFACELDGLRAWRGERGADHRFPPEPHVDVGEAFTLLVDPSGHPVPLACLELHYAVTYRELHATPSPWAVDKMLDILGEVRRSQPQLIHEAFAATKSEFSERAHDAFYVVSDLMAMSRLGGDPFVYLRGTDRWFGDHELAIPIAGEYHLGVDGLA